MAPGLYGIWRIEDHVPFDATSGALAHPVHAVTIKPISRVPNQQFVWPFNIAAHDWLAHIRGIVSLSSQLHRGTPMQLGVDYEPLREALKEQDFLKADDIHRKKLIEVAGEAAQERGWVWFSEVCHVVLQSPEQLEPW